MARVGWDQYLPTGGVLDRGLHISDMLVVCIPLSEGNVYDTDFESHTDIDCLSAGATAFGVYFVSPGLGSGETYPGKRRRASNRR